MIITTATMPMMAEKMLTIFLMVSLIVCVPVLMSCVQPPVPSTVRVVPHCRLFWMSLVAAYTATGATAGTSTIAKLATMATIFLRNVVNIFVPFLEFVYFIAHRRRRFN